MPSGLPGTESVALLSSSCSLKGHLLEAKKLKDTKREGQLYLLGALGDLAHLLVEVSNRNLAWA